MGLYLGGRGLLKPPLSEFESKDAGKHSTRKAISQPLVIAGQTTPEGLPKPWELQAIGRKALETSVSKDRYTASLGRWSVDVRPILREWGGVLQMSYGGGRGQLPTGWRGAAGRSEDRRRPRSGDLCVPSACGTVNHRRRDSGKGALSHPVRDCPAHLEFPEGLGQYCPDEKDGKRDETHGKRI